MLESVGGGILSGVAASLLVCCVIFAHGMGHFLVARFCRVGIASISFGSGPEILGYDDRQGTRWKIGSIPFGGHIKFAAAAPEPPPMAVTAQNTSFAHQHAGKRAAILIAGPLASLLLAIGLFAAASYADGRVITVARVGTVQPGSPAEMAGVLPGDVFLSIDGRQVESFADVQRIVQSNAGPMLTVNFDRGGERVTLKVAPALHEITDSSGNVQQMRIIGVGRSLQPGDVQRVGVPLLAALGMGLQETWDTVKFTYLQIADVWSPPGDFLGGPVSIGPPIPASSILHAILTLTASASLVLAAFNVLPIPIGDGGDLLWCAIEVLRKRPVSDRTRATGFFIALAGGIILLLLVIIRNLSYVIPR
jgi:regulator of sigma E protease